MDAHKPLKWLKKLSFRTKKKQKEPDEGCLVVPSSSKPRNILPPQKLTSVTFFGNQWDQIPVDMLREIFLRIHDGADLLACYQVNRMWKATLTVMEGQLWKKICLMEWKIEEAHLCSVDNWKEAWKKSNEYNFNVVHVVASEVENLKTKSSLFHHFLMLDSLKFPALPSSLFSVGQLKRLYLNGNGLTKLPEGVGNLKGLNILDLSNNLLSTLPEEMASLTSLRYVYLSKNRFQQVPAVVSSWVSVTALYLDNNMITAVPHFLTELPELRCLFLHNNPLNQRSFNLLKKKKKPNANCV